MKKLFSISILLLIVSSIGIFQCNNDNSAEKVFQQGLDYLNTKDLKNAYKYFKKASDKDQDNPRYHWYAASVAPNSNMVFIHTKSAWDNGMKTFPVLLTLTRLSSHSQKSEKLTYALSLFKQLPDTSKTDYVRADLYMQFAEFDTSLAILLRLFKQKPTAQLCNKIAYVYSKAGKSEKARKFLDKWERKKLLDSKGYTMLANLYALEYDYDGIMRLITRAKKYGLYNDPMQLELGGFYIIQGKIAAAESILVDFIEPPEDKVKEKLYRSGRVILSYIYYAQKKSSQIESLISVVKGKVKEDHPELLLYQFLVRSLEEKTNNPKQLKPIKEKLGQYPVVELIYARMNAIMKNFNEAHESYRKLPLVFLRSPRILIEYAVTLTKLGKYDEALANITLMHKRKKFTKNSLELFRDLTFKKQLFEKSMAAQKLLEKKYKGNIDILYSRALLAMKTGKTDSALHILNQLVDKFPQEARFELSRISVYFFKEDYQRVVAECQKSKLKRSQLVPLLARALIKLGKAGLAEKAYEQSIAKEKSLPLMVDYAQFLIKIDRPGKASQVYNRIMNTYKRKLENDKQGSAALLNNFAWSLLQDPHAEKKTALEAAEKAFALSPNVHILDTYVLALIANKKYKQCITILLKNEMTDNEPKLLIALARAYRETGKTTVAKNFFEDALKLYEQKGSYKLSIKRGEIEKHLGAGSVGG